MPEEVKINGFVSRDIAISCSRCQSLNMDKQCSQSFV